MAALGFAAVPLGVWLGSHMPWVDPETLGPNHAGYYLSAYLWLALPNILLTSALFFALATITRSMMATYVGVVAFLILFTVTSVVLDRNPAYELWGAYGEPLGLGASLAEDGQAVADRVLERLHPVPVAGHAREAVDDRRRAGRLVVVADDVDRADARHVLHEVFHLGAVAFG